MRACPRLSRHAHADRILKLEPVRLEPPAVEAIRGAASTARALQARLRGVAASMERVEAALAQLDARAAARRPA